MLIKQLYNPFNSLMPRQCASSLRSQVTALVVHHEPPIKADLFGCHHCRTSLSCTHYWSINCTKLAQWCMAWEGDFHVMWSCHISGTAPLVHPSAAARRNHMLLLCTVLIQFAQIAAWILVRARLRVYESASVWPEGSREGENQH